MSVAGALMEVLLSLAGNCWSSSTRFENGMHECMLTGTYSLQLTQGGNAATQWSLRKTTNAARPR